MYSNILEVRHEDLTASGRFLIPTEDIGQVVIRAVTSPYSEEQIEAADVERMQMEGQADHEVLKQQGLKDCMSGNRTSEAFKYYSHWELVLDIANRKIDRPRL